MSTSNMDFSSGTTAQYSCNFTLQDPLTIIFGPNGIAKRVTAPALSPIKQPNDDGPRISNNKSAAKTEGKKKM
ncbi:uncharacterized protein EDB91DRAFT_1248136 [Suillus paluster]|uniref:uncharacterized protein n=1 Tax=Suillus paluster TaxID=48578 RepID=UPI001B867DAF|nr:uncharacterized protein EDB91DRAFT_1248136 [Suillus paluster]KAG1740742.1 hypothetical protein EDB91DRAFT_1248136 [Suillus paluster]